MSDKEFIERLDFASERIAELEAELEGATKVVEILTKLGSHDMNAAKWIAEARELLEDATYHDGRYNQASTKIWQDAANALLKEGSDG